MGTTSLVVELLIIGFQVATWVVLLLLSVFGYEWIDLRFLTSWAALVTVVFLAASYSLGLIFDAILLEVTKALSKATKKAVATAVTELARERGIQFDHELPVMMRTYVLAKNPALQGYLEREGYGFRLLLATSGNLVLICCFTLLFLATRIGLTCISLATVVLVFLLPAGFSGYAWYIKYRYYYLELALIYQAIKAPRAPLHKTAPRGRSKPATR